MLTLEQHFDADFSGERMKSEDFSLEVNLSAQRNHERVNVRLHLDFDKEEYFIAILCPVDSVNWSSQEFQSLVAAIPHLMSQCLENVSTKFKGAKKVYIYTTDQQANNLFEQEELTVFYRGPGYPQLMDRFHLLVSNYLQNYEAEAKNTYEKAAQFVRAEIERLLKQDKIIAIVNHRCKSSDRLKEKLLVRGLPIEEPKKCSYRQPSDITGDIVDLAGVRVALYFPSDTENVSKIITERFPQNNEVVSFPNAEQRERRKELRFCGYEAIHVRVNVDGNDIGINAGSFRVEVQIASVIMHAWAEVEHDLIYKELDGKISEQERQMLEQLNGLVLAGQISLEELKKARDERKSKSASSAILSGVAGPVGGEPVGGGPVGGG